MMIDNRVAELTAADRCDRCGAQAYMQATLPYGSFYFCAHHAREHGPRLAEVGALIRDETDRARD